ncbi:MAG: zeta toxin family protein [Firmicutes bacterium]|nr:zeta toxin family protein [Bacillota bacterium]
MDTENMQISNQTPEKKPELTIFAGPNGSGKSTIYEYAIKHGTYINADVIKASTHCDDLTAAKQAEALRENALAQKSDFTFETVLSTERNLNLLRRAREQGYFIRGYFVFTRHPNINVLRVQSRTEEGGHNVPIDKILKRYKLTMANLPELIRLCDICHVYDNTQELFRIFKKRKGEHLFFTSKLWTEEKIKNLVYKPVEDE